MALGDKPKDQTVAPKKAPAIKQLTANANISAGGNNTAAAGSNNIPQGGRQGAYILPTPLSQTTPTVQKDRAGGIIKSTPSLIPNRGYNPTSPTIPGVKRVGDSFSGTTGSWDSSSSALPSKPTVPTSNPAITNPAQIGQKPELPNSSSLPTPVLGEIPSSVSNVNGVKTLSAGGGTISSSSPAFGNSSPQRLSDLDRTLAMDKNPEVIAHRAESADMATKRYDDALRGGLSRAEYENPLGATQLLKQMQVAKANNDVVGYGFAAKTLREALGNDVTRRGQDISADNSARSSQAESAKLGYNQFKDQLDYETEQRNKALDRSLEVQKAQLGTEKDIASMVDNPINAFGDRSIATSFSNINTMGGNTWGSLDRIVGPETAASIKAEPDTNKVIAALQAKGLDADSIKIMLRHRQQ